MSILPYTPGNMSYEELKACFVGRQPLLDELLDTLREQAAASTLQHWMILGSRGMGKTHLIRLFHHEIIKDQDLTKLWLPILMNEEEPEVFNLPTLFIRIIQMLAESLENRGYRDDAQHINAFMDTLRDNVKGQTQLLDRATAYLKQFSKDRGRRIVVLLENADDLLTKCLPNTSDVQKLRKILSMETCLRYAVARSSNWVCPLTLSRRVSRNALIGRAASRHPRFSNDSASIGIMRLNNVARLKT